jgi:hypothetical protein
LKTLIGHYVDKIWDLSLKKLERERKDEESRKKILLVIYFFNHVCWNLYYRQRVEDLVAQCGGKKVAAILAINVVTYTIPEEAFEEVKSELIGNGTATFVERDLIRSIHTPIDAAPFNVDMIPNDPYYPNQWGPKCIDAEQAWNYENLFVHPDLIVAVIDTGVDLDHPDLANQVDTGIDYDFVNNDNEAMDDNGHGTHCAGIIAAEIDNQIGIAGLQDVTIMAVKGLDENGSGWDSILAQCITFILLHWPRLPTMHLVKGRLSWQRLETTV